LTSNEPLFRTVIIAGLGLIGGSIALGLRERWPSTRIVGVDRAAVQTHAQSSGAIDRGAATLAEAGQADLIVLAAPVRENIRLLEEAVSAARPQTLITDVGGTKRDIVAAAGKLSGHDVFVGGHPIGGGERGGFGFARPDLFVGRPWIFTPTHESSADAVDRLFHLARGLGAVPTPVDAARHDLIMAYLSHLPQLTATALMHVAGQGASAEHLQLSGRGLLDTTRLASSPANVWRDICAANADLIGQALDELIAALTALRADLSSPQSIDELFADAARWRAELLKHQQH
jgi:prephenate dehydrogenase